MGKKTRATPGLSRRDQRILDRNAIAAPERTPYQSSFQPPKLVPKNDRQRDAMDALRDMVPVVFLIGSAGVGKSLLAAEHVASWLKSKAGQDRKVYLVRPAVGVGNSIGLLPGEIEAKIGPYFAQTLEHIGKFLKPGDMKYMLEKKTIEMQPVEFLRGRSFENCIVLLEECQNFTHEEFEMLLTRMGEGAQAIFTGDQKQNDLKRASGLNDTVDLLCRMIDTQPDYLEDEDLDALDDGFAVVRFTPDDVVRSGFTRAVVRIYHHN